MSDPLISVVIPTYYRTSNLKRAIASVVAQTHDRVEIIIVDDSGERFAEDIVESLPKVTYVGLEQNRGPMATRAVGNTAAHGKYVQFLDDDDWMATSRLEKGLRKLRTSGCNVVYSGVELEDIRTDVPPNAPSGDVLDSSLRFGMYPCLPSTLLIEESTLTAALSDPLPRVDVEFIIRLAMEAEFAYIPAPLIIKGNSDEHRGLSMANAENMRRTIERLRSVYQAQPPDVRREAVRAYYHRRIRADLSNARWFSRSAIAAALKSCLNVDGLLPTERSLRDLGLAVLGPAYWRYRRRRMFK